MESFGETCDRIVRALLAESGPLLDREGTPPADRVHLPASFLPDEAAPSDSAAPGAACRRLPPELCLELCIDSFRAEAPGEKLDVATFEALRDAEGNPLHLCDLALSAEPGRRAVAAPCSGRAQTDAAVGTYLAGMAQIEAAGVGSFEDLAEELGTHGAPADLIERARKAQTDQRVHVVLVSRLAARHGATASAAGRNRREKPRSFTAFACRNAAEGCGSAAYGALALSWAASTARDLSMRALARHLAEDEARQADLALEIHAWAKGRLPPDKAARLADLRATAIRNAAREAPPALVQVRLGVPSADVADRLAERLIEALSPS